MIGARKAQSTLEYIIIFTAVVAAIIIFANTVMKKKVQSSLEHVADQMESEVKKIDFGG
ncbi:MAG: class III signal peptide-containing protein [Candidatus Omnitrophica bacterium]|nr:class III signal peptide-containing protein [Candidatus Omnitrophota bacterium]